jgi:spore germination cell wall hydrolase CwlJ-like protein
MIYDDNDVHSLALCAWKEARGEGKDGVWAVMWVIKNRVGHPGFAHTLHDVIYGKNQFTSMSVPSDPEFNLEPKDDDEIWQSCRLQAAAVLGGGEVGCVNDGSQEFLPDPTKGAHYYANLHNCTSGWFHDNIVLNTHDHPITAQIGRHTFFY